MRALVALVGVVAVCAGCAATNPTLQPASTLPRGGQEVGLGAVIQAPYTSALADYDCLDREDCMPESREQLERASTGLAVAPPAMNPELVYRYGLKDQLQVGGGLSVRGLRAEGKGRLIDDGGWTLALSGGLGYWHRFGMMVPEGLEPHLDIERFHRVSAEVGLLVGRRLMASLEIYLGPRYSASYYTVSAEVDGQPISDLFPDHGLVHEFGGVAGAMWGRDPIHLLMEVARYRINAPGEVFDGVVWMPAFGVACRWK